MPDSATLVLEPPRGVFDLRVRELWEYRELLLFLVWRDIKVRYKQTALGVAWAVLQPLLAMVIFTIFFGRLAKVPSNGVPYPVFSYAALVPWTYFATVLGVASNCLIDSSQLLTKVYFPRLMLPAASILAGFADYGVSFVVLLGMLIFYRVAPTSSALLALPFALLAALTALAAGLWISALNVHYRDLRYTVPFLIQIWLFASPVVYPTSLVPSQWRFLYGLNPMATAIDGFRWSVLGTAPPAPELMAASVLAVTLALAGGLWFFSRMERTFGDIV